MLQERYIESYHRYRPYLFAIAYRMLGSAADAEDVVQETFVRWQESGAEAASPRAYLASVATRLCIDQLRSAARQREEYVGPWLPEPIVLDDQRVEGDPAALAESVSLAMMTMLETLDPVERAVLLLHDVFAYTFEEIATIVDKRPATCRKIAQRAREHVQSGRPRFTPSAEGGERLAEQFLHACSTGDLPGLVSLLAEDATLWADGGGRVAAVPRPIHGAETIATFLVGVSRKLQRGMELRVTPVNGEPGIVASLDGTVDTVFVLEVVAGRIVAIRAVRNPDKLQVLQRQLDALRSSATGGSV